MYEYFQLKIKQYIYAKQCYKHRRKSQRGLSLENERFVLLIEIYQ